MTSKYDYNGQPLWHQKPIKEMLPYVSSMLETLGIKYWLDWGTLLGAVRNGKMIPWDFDIDVGIFHKDVKKLLAAEPQVRKDGFEFKVDRNSQYARKIRFFGKDGFDFHIDIDPWIMKDGKVMTTYGDNRFRTVEELSVLSTIEFEGGTYPCPMKPEEGLVRMLGEDYMTPKVGSGNKIYIEQHHPDNKDILEEVVKYAGC